jgi:hypothetical protein
MSDLSHGILYGLVVFYGVLTMIVSYRAMRPSCRVCVRWQRCLPARLGLTDSPLERCKPTTRVP